MENMLKITRNIIIPLEEVECKAVRSQGPGGQNVNKVSTAVHLRFDIKNSSLADIYKKRLLQLNDRRISKEGIIIIQSQQYRSQKKNKDIAFIRLQKLIENGISVHKKRIPTKPTLSSQIKRLESKAKRGLVKRLRKKVT